MTLEVQCASAVDFDLVDVESPVRRSRRAVAFRTRAALSQGFELVVAGGDGASLDREACDEYHVRVNATNADGWSVATVEVRVADVNDAEVVAVRRKDGGALDELPSSGGTVVVFEGSGLGRVDPTKPPTISARYEHEDASNGGAAFDATDCDVVRAHAAARCDAPPCGAAAYRVDATVNGLHVPSSNRTWYTVPAIDHDGPGATRGSARRRLVTSTAAAPSRRLDAKYGRVEAPGVLAGLSARWWWARRWWRR